MLHRETCAGGCRCVRTVIGFAFPGVDIDQMATGMAIIQQKIRLFMLWFFVGVPLAWGVFKTLQHAMALFQ